MTDASIHIRPAGVADLPALSNFALALAQLHATFDRQRFCVPDERAFRQFFKTELARNDATLLIAEHDGEQLGYAFVRLEPASIEALCDPAAWLHDLYVRPDERTRGVGRLLVEAAFETAIRFGSKTLMLGVSPHNASAQTLFERMGFRPTMIEMRADFQAPE